jgi:hypothetical protein
LPQLLINLLGDGLFRALLLFPRAFEILAGVEHIL